ncbi:polysaccharide deacetylase family protein [Streptomyces sp. NPDC046759]|uniref:polysaccharide deacetylase family protein n=1 Tax=Streptomyces sp. NPDC046759 TaxID=3155019 RepID=UPI0033D4164A
MTPRVRRITAVCALSAALAACGSAGHTGGARQAPAKSPVSASPSAPRPPVLAPGPEGLTPVFEHGPRTLGKTVALTFDADMTAAEGPRAAAGEHFDNPDLIGALHELKVPATIFMTGRWADEYPVEARSLGHDPQFEVANHSYSHYAFTDHCYGLPAVGAGKMRSDVERAYASLHKAGVSHALPYFRFPGGCYDRKALRALSGLGLTAIQWDVVSGDAFATDADAVTRQVLDGVKPGSVVIMHCTRSAAPTTERVVRAVVPELRKRGYRFVKVSTLIGETSGHR